MLPPAPISLATVELGENSSVWFQCVLRGDIEPIRVGANSNIQDGTIIHTMKGAPAVVGDWVTVGHRAVLHGCTVENHCLIGMGAVLLNHVHVGEGSIVAAGAAGGGKHRDSASKPLHGRSRQAPADGNGGRTGIHRDACRRIICDTRVEYLAEASIKSVAAALANRENCQVYALLP